jgi:hypothetical protein
MTLAMSGRRSNDTPARVMSEQKGKPLGITSYWRNRHVSRRISCIRITEANTHMRDGHLNPDKVSSLFFGNLALSQEQNSHLRSCKQCNEWLTVLAKLAIDAKVIVSFDIPPLKDSNSDTTERWGAAQTGT